MLVFARYSVSVVVVQGERGRQSQGWHGVVVKILFPAGGITDGAGLSRW